MSDQRNIQHPISWLFSSQVKKYPKIPVHGSRRHSCVRTMLFPTKPSPRLKYLTGFGPPGWRVNPARMDKFLKDLELLVKANVMWRDALQVSGDNEVLKSRAIQEGQIFNSRYGDIVQKLATIPQSPPGVPVVPFVNPTYFRAKESNKYFWRLVDLMNELYFAKPGELRGNPHTERTEEWKEKGPIVHRMLLQGIPQPKIARKLFRKKVDEFGIPDQVKMGISRRKLKIHPRNTK